MGIQYNHTNKRKGIGMEYKNFKIIFSSELNKYLIVDEQFKQEIKCSSVQACKIRISKLIASRERIANILK